MEFRDAVKYLRSELGLTQMELAGALHVSAVTIGRWEKGENLPNRSITAALMAFAREKGASKSCLDALERSVAQVARGRLGLSGLSYSAGQSTLLEPVDGAQFRGIIDNMNGGVSAVVFGEDGEQRYVYRNKRFYALFGCTEEQFDAEYAGPLAVVAPEDHDYVCSVIDGVRRNGQPASFRFRARKRSGGALTVGCHVSLASVPGLGDGVLLSVMTDISEVVKLERQALVFGQRLNAIMDEINSGVAASIVREDGSVDYIFVTDRYYELLGYTREQYHRQVSDPFSLIHEDDRQKVRASAFSLKEPGQSLELRYRAHRQDGCLIWLDVSINMMTFADVDRPVMLSVFTDITAQVEANRQLAAQRDEINEMLNSTPSGIAVIEVDPENVAGLHTVYYNDRFFAYSGYTREEYDAIIQGNEMGMVFEEDIPNLVSDTLRICRGDIGFSANSTVRCHTKSGGYRWLLLTGQLAERRGRVCVVKISMVDVTELREAEDSVRMSEEMFRLAAETDKRALVIFDVKANTCLVESHSLYSAKYGELLENIPQSLLDTGIASPECATELSELFDRLRRGEVSVCTSLLLRTGEREYQWFECNASAVTDADGRPDRAVLVFHNITEQRLKEAVYKKWRQSIASRPADSYSFFRCNLSKGEGTDQREGGLLTYSFPPEMSFNQRAAAYAEHFVHPDDRVSYIQLLDSDSLLAMFYRGEHTASLEYREVGEDGISRWRLLTVEMVEYLNSADIQAFLMYEDIDERRKAELLEQERAETDPLTGLLNRASFTEKVEAHIADGGKSQHALLMLDMDGFKLLNDTFGHAAGDQALLDTAAVLRSMVRDGDLICRLGGDEFIVWLRDIPYDAVIEKIARQICEQVRKAFRHDVELSASIGVAVYPRDGRDYDSLYHCADKALYRVKQTGKNSYSFFSASERGQSGDALAPSERGAITRSEAKAKRRMLVVDDDKISRLMLSKVFGSEYQVEEAKNGAEAMLRLRHFSTSVSVVLLDLMMPDMDGYEVLRKMQADVDLRTIPVIVVSGSDDRETLLKAIESGATDYVTKPVDTELIRIRVRSAISKAENERLMAQNSYLRLQREEELKYRTVLESTGTVVVEYDWHNRVFIYDNTITDCLAGSYDHRPLWQVFLSDMVADSSDVKAMQDGLLALATDRSRSKFSRLVMLKTPSKQKHWFRMNVYKQADSFGLAEKMMITFNDVHEEVLSNEKLLFQATRDELTGLYNRAGFIRRATELIADREPGYYILACLDIEKFKVINDQYGTARGDEVLRQLARVLEGFNGGRDTLCCRVSGDNFTVLYPAAILDTAEIARNHDAAQLLDGTLPTLRIYVGRCLVDDKSLPVSAIYDRASIAKETVKGRYDAYVATYDESMRASILRRQAITGQMNAALTGGQFEVWLQPQFNHSTGMLSGAESLVRWRHPKEGLIAPAAFIPIFEQNGFVYELDKFVWEQTCVLLRGWLDRGLHPVPVSVNISRYDVFRGDLISVVSGLVEKYGLSRDMLRLEITESAFSESSEQIIRVVRQLVELGFVVEIDDFGSGYSSLNTLKDVPAQVLKLDMKFLENDSNAQRGGSIIESVIRMARWLGMSVIAEGVETVEQADYLRSIGCEHIQGFLYSRPVEAPEFERIFIGGLTESGLSRVQTMDTWNNNAFWNPKSMETLIFNSYVGGACIFEYCRGAAELIRYNKGYADIFRFDFSFSDVHQDVLSFLDEANRGELLGCISSALESKQEASCELRLTAAGGRLFFVRVTLRQIAQAGDRALFYCVVSDVTAQREAEQGEREAASRVAAIMDNVDGGITAVCTRNGRPEMIFSNDRFYSQLGYTREQFKNELNIYFDAIHPEDRNRVWNKVGQTLRSGTPCSMEYRCVKRDGSLIYVRSNIAICTIAGIEGDVMITVETDISELEEAQRKIAGASDRLKAIMDNASCGITAVVLDKDATADYLLVNDRYYELVGYTREQYEAAGLKGLELMHPEDLREYEKRIVQLDAVGQTGTFEFRARRRDGSWIWLRDDIAVISLNGVEAPVQLSCFTDITARRLAEERLTQLLSSRDVTGDELALSKAP